MAPELMKGAASQKIVSLEKFYCDKCHVIMSVTALVQGSCPLCVQKDLKQAKDGILTKPPLGKAGKLVLETEASLDEEVEDVMLPNRLVGYGKYMHKTFAWVLENDVQYCKWTLENQGRLTNIHAPLFVRYLSNHLSLVKGDRSSTRNNHVIRKDTGQLVEETKQSKLSRDPPVAPLMSVIERLISVIRANGSAPSSGSAQESTQ
jgi:hypothetical protein